MTGNRPWRFLLVALVAGALAPAVGHADVIVNDATLPPVPGRVVVVQPLVRPRTLGGLHARRAPVVQHEPRDDLWMIIGSALAAGLAGALVGGALNRAARSGDFEPARRRGEGAVDQAGV